MKVLIASDADYPIVAGSSIFTQRLAEALANRGHEVAIISPSESLGHSTKMRGNVRHFGIRSFPTYINNLRVVLPLTFERQVRKVLREFQPDIVHIQMHFAISRATLNAALKRGIPVVATNHFMPDNLTHYLRLPKAVEQGIHRIMWGDAARTLGKAHGVSSPTDIAGAILKIYLPHMRTISNGIDRQHFNPSNDPEPARTQYHLPRKPIALFVGRLDREKNVDIVLKAVAQALTQLDFHFVIAGKGQEQKKLEHLAQQLGISSHVTFCGFVPDALLPSLYAAADCFVNACTAELQCIAAMEAMASGLPFIGARAVALPELIHHGKNGFLFEPGNVEELAQHLVTVLSNPERRERMRESSLSIIAHHDSNAVLEQFEDFYREALNAQTTA